MELVLPAGSDPFTLLVKPAGSACNIDCTYCYDKRRFAAQSARLSRATLERTLALAGRHPLDVVFHGGEPLLVGLDALADMIALCRAAAAVRSIAIQTNGLLLDAQAVDFLVEYDDIEVAVSFDGLGEGSQYRRSYHGEATAEDVMAAMSRLGERDRRFSVIAVVSAATLFRGPAALFQDLASLTTLSALKLTPCLDTAVVQSTSGRRLRSRSTITLLDQQTDGARASWAVTPAQYTAFVIDAIDQWIESGSFARFRLEPALAVMLALFGADPGYTDFSRRKQPFLLTLDPDGTLSTSDEFEGQDALIGNVADLTGDLTEHVRHRLAPLWDRCATVLASCAGCCAEDICRGGNLPDRLAFATRPDLAAQYCESRIQLVNFMRERVAQARPTAGLVTGGAEGSVAR